jgi:hypothetical protein
MKRLTMFLFSLIAATAFAGTVPLSISQGTAFQTLGRWCGGIKVQEFASGFNAAGLPTADAYLTTRCGGSGRGGGYHVTTYSTWVKITWDLGGVLVSAVDEPEPASEDLTATFTNGPYSESTQAGTFQLVPGDPYVYSTAILITP